MKKLNLKILNFKSIKDTFKRFPFTITSATLASIFFIMATYDEYAEDFNNKMISYGLVFAFAIFLYAFIKLFNEGLRNFYDLKNLKNNNLLKVISYVITLPILYGIYELVYDKAGPLSNYNDNFVFFTLIAFLVVGTSFVAKFNYHKDYVVYVAKILRAFIISKFTAS